MSFFEILKNDNMDYVLQGEPFKRLLPMNTDKVLREVKRICDENLNVFIDPDCDPDGYFSARVIMQMFKQLGHTRYTVGAHTEKRHVLPQTYAASIYRQGYDVLFITDSSTNSMDLITLAAGYGVTVIIIDHHETEYTFEDYPNNCVIVNPVIDSKLMPVDYAALSACAVCALVADYVIYSITGRHAPTVFYLYGVITLYSDCCNLSNPYNIAYIRQFQNRAIIDCPIIKLFWNDTYSHFDKSYIAFQLVPRINALMRTEQFELLHELFFDDTANYMQLAEAIEKIYQSCRDFADKLKHSCQITKYDSIAVALLPDDIEPVARNFTGYIANKICDDTGQTVLCLYSEDYNRYGGSVRDPFNRDMLSIFCRLCYAAGHQSAFGISMQKTELPDIITTLDCMTEAFSKNINSLIVVDWDTAKREDIEADAFYMASYNEFGGIGLPKAVGRMTIPREAKIYRGNKCTSIYVHGLKVVSFTNIIDYGDTILVSPTLSGASYELLVDNIIYNT